MATSLAYVAGKNSEISLLACRQLSGLPAERQIWAGVAPEPARTPQDILRTAKTYGLKVLDLLQLDCGSTATLLEDSLQLQDIHRYFGYMLRVAPGVGKDLMDEETQLEITKDPFGCLEGEYSGLDADTWALCVLKPDAKQLGMEQEIFDQIAQRGLAIRSMIAGRALSICDLDQLWPAPVHDSRTPVIPSPWWASTVNYMRQSPVDIVLVNGQNATEVMKDLKADLRTKIYGSDHQRNEALTMEERVKSIIHTSDCNKELITNVAAFWSSNELEKIIEDMKQ